MAPRIGVLAIHGMGDPEPNFAAGLFDRLSRRLGQDAGAVAFADCYWSPILQDYQDITWQRLVASGRMDAKLLRKWLLSALGDPASYLAGFFRDDKPVYAEIHERVRMSLATLEAQLGNTSTPLVILAHSLGSVIMSNYMWDEQTGKGIGTTPFERMETVTSFVTYGSTIPLFLPPRDEIVCIRFPSPKLPERLRPFARWLNIYDPDDVLGYPLRGVWTNTQGTEITDLTINAGWWPLSETPFAHNYYNQDDDFLDRVVAEIRGPLHA